MTAPRAARSASLTFTWVLAIGSLAGYAALAHAHGSSVTALRLPRTGLTILGWVGLLIGLTVAERVEAHIEVRRQSFRLTVTEAPLVLGLVLVSPLALLGLMLCARSLTWIGSRQNLFKRACNIGISTLEVGVIECVAHAGGLGWLHPGAAALGQPLSGTAVIAVFAATVASSLSGTTVAVVVLTWLHGAVEGETRLRLFSVQALSASAGAIFALLALDLAPHDTIGLSMLGLLLVGAIGGYRAYAGLLRQHRTVNQLYDFSQALSLSPASPEDLPASVLDGVLAAMECDKAILWQRGDGVLVPAARGLSMEEALRSSGIAQLVYTDCRPLLLRMPSASLGGHRRSRAGPSRPG